MRPAIGFILLTIALIFSCGPDPSGRDSSPINFLEPPYMEQQEPLAIRMTRGGYDISVTKKAAYTVRGIVTGRENYYSGWNSLLSPADVSLCWGRLAENGMYKRLKWSQGNRWYFWSAGDDFGYNNDFVAQHSSNNHVIPATPNLAKAVKSLKPGYVVEMTGHLVDVAAVKQSENHRWYSSTSTADRGDGSCEILYVTRIKVHGRIYQ